MQDNAAVISLPEDKSPALPSSYCPYFPKKSQQTDSHMAGYASCVLAPKEFSGVRHLNVQPRSPCQSVQREDEKDRI